MNQYIGELSCQGLLPPRTVFCSYAVLDDFDYFVDDLYYSVQQVEDTFSEELYETACA